VFFMDLLVEVGSVKKSKKLDQFFRGGGKWKKVVVFFRQGDGRQRGRGSRKRDPSLPRFICGQALP